MLNIYIYLAISNFNKILIYKTFIMRKTTLLSLLFLLSVSFSALIAQNNGSESGSNRILSSKNALGVQLNQENQNFYNQTGLVKCLSEEMNAKYAQDNPNRMSKEQFEEWLAPLVAEYKANKAQQVASGNLMPDIYYIPIIFHVVSGNAGDAANLSQALVNAQIDQLNLDFSNLAGADGGFWDGRDADSTIRCVPLTEPGINRVFGYPGQLGTADFDNNIKPATIWDRTRYCNIWTGNLGGGLLGYAQFPDNSTLPGMPGGAGGAANTDGVVCTYTSIGSVAMPHPAGGPYNAGRTLTHEIGHWIGLRHIWGDGGCGADDFCADTPNAGGSNFGCPNTNDSCAGDADRDMVENYMDYTDDTCMDIFTNDQVARMIVVLQNSPGRTTLVQDPVVSFRGVSASVNEGTDCSFTDVNFEIMIHQPASADATLTFAIDGGTANNIEDYTIQTATITIPANTTANQTGTIRVFNDSNFEGNETISLTFTLNANGGDAVVGEDKYELTIIDDDEDPTVGSPSVIFSDDFESGLGNWTVTGNGAPSFTIKNNATYTDGGFFASDGSNTTNYVSVNDDADCGAANPGCNYGNERIAMSTSLDLSSYSEATLTFDYVHDNQYVAAEFAAVDVSVDNGATWTQLELINPVDAAPSSPFIAASVDASAYTGAGMTNVRFSFYYTDGNDWGQGLILDNFVVSAPQSREVQTAVNDGTTSDQILLTPNGAGTAFDTVSSNIILDVDVTNASDFGCTTASVSRSGISAQSYNGSIAPALVTDKTFTITPSILVATGTSSISFYFTEAELTGWESATGDSRANLQIGKDNGASLETVSATITAFGSDWKVTGNFTSGLNGTYYFGNMAFLSTEDFTFDSFVMYPNPSNGSLTIGFNTSNDVNVNLYDIRGRSVLNKNFNASGSKFNQTLNLASLATGVYVVKINSGSNTMFRKLVVN